MEELIKRLAELQAERNSLRAQADFAVYNKGYDRDISKLEEDLERLKHSEKHVRFAYAWRCDELGSEIESVSEQIIDEWTGEKKTMVFGDRILKFTTRGSLNIVNELYLFAELYNHVTIDELVEKYLTGFNLTAVNKYMGVHRVPGAVAQIEYKTTVKLE